MLVVRCWSDELLLSGLNMRRKRFLHHRQVGTCLADHEGYEEGRDAQGSPEGGQHAA